MSIGLRTIQLPTSSIFVLICFFSTFGNISNWSIPFLTKALTNSHCSLNWVWDYHFVHFSVTCCWRKELFLHPARNICSRTDFSWRSWRLQPRLQQFVLGVSKVLVSNYSAHVNTNLSIQHLGALQTKQSRKVCALNTWQSRITKPLFEWVFHLQTHGFLYMGHIPSDSFNLLSWLNMENLSLTSGYSTHLFFLLVS